MPTARNEPHVPTRFNGVAPAQIGDALLPSNAPICNETTPCDSKCIEYKTIARLRGSWYSDIPNNGLKHFVRFESDGTGSLRTLTQIGEQDMRYCPFTYTFDETKQSIQFTFRALNDLELQNPLLVQTFHVPTSGTIKEVSLQAESVPDLVLKHHASAAQAYKPTEQLVFEQSPWPDTLYPDSTTFVGRFASVAFRGTALNM